MATKKPQSSARILAVVLAALATCNAQGAIDFSQNTPNPFQGQNLPPTSVDDYPIEVFALLEDLYEVDELRYTFTIVFRLLMRYEDPQTVQKAMNDPSSNCTFYCASEATSVLNVAGQPACCSRAFIPGVQAVNMISIAGQDTPANYVLSPLSNTTVSYSSSTRATYSMDLQYSSYPFDKHFLAVDFMTPFVIDPNSGGTFVEATDGTLVGGNSSTPVTRGSLTAIDLPAWQVVNTHFEVMNYTTGYSKAGKNAKDLQNGVMLSELSGRGFRIALEVERRQRGFYVVVEILPVCLIVVFSFCAFSLPIHNVKARFNVLAAQFLTLVVLQFILYSVLPATFEVIKPYLLICISYALLICMCLEVIVVNWLRCRFKAPLKAIQASEAKRAYQQWAERLHADAPDRDAKAVLSVGSAESVAPLDSRGSAAGSSAIDTSLAHLPDAERGAAMLLAASRGSVIDTEQQRLERWKKSWLWRHSLLRQALAACALAWHEDGLDAEASGLQGGAAALAVHGAAGRRGVLRLCCHCCRPLLLRLLGGRLRRHCGHPLSAGLPELQPCHRLTRLQPRSFSPRLVSLSDHRSPCGQEDAELSFLAALTASVSQAAYVHLRSLRSLARLANALHCDAGSIFSFPCHASRLGLEPIPMVAAA